MKIKIISILISVVGWALYSLILNKGRLLDFDFRQFTAGFVLALFVLIGSEID